MKLNEYIRSRVGSIIIESIRSRDVEKAISLMSSYLRKRKIYTIPVTNTCEVDGRKKLAVLVWTEKNTGACFYWDIAATAQVEGVMFTKDSDQILADWDKGMPNNWEVSVNTTGTNIVQALKLVEEVLTESIPMTVNAIHEFLADTQLFESITDPIVLAKRKTLMNLRAKYSMAKKKGQTDKMEDLQKLIDAAKEDYTNSKISVQDKIQTVPIPDPDMEKSQARFEEQVRATPEERFSDMEDYIKGVIKGFDNLALLCGAPGVGKTYRVLKLVNSVLEKDKDYKLMKGKSTATNLYTSLYDYKDKGKMLIFDDCDSIFKDPDAVNLLKAAYDSSDNRYVSWGTARPPQMDPEIAEINNVPPADNGKYYYPKEFLYEGTGIIITNWRAGAIDTAIKNRAVICDLDFTAQEILDLVEGIAPHIMPDVLTKEAKEKAIKYLQEMVDNKIPVEISIRSFTTVAKRYMSNAPEPAIRRRINEQMRNQFASGGPKSY